MTAELNTRVARFFLVQYTKMGKTVQDDPKIMAVNVPNGHKYTNTVHSKALQYISKLIFLVRKYIYHLATLLNTAVSVMYMCAVVASPRPGHNSPLPETGFRSVVS
jgi:hypothetical protein